MLTQITVVVLAVLGSVVGHRDLLETASKEGKIWKTDSPIQIPADGCETFVLEPGKTFGYKSTIVSITGGCGNLQISRLYMEDSCMEQRTGLRDDIPKADDVFEKALNAENLSAIAPCTGIYKFGTQVDLDNEETCAKVFEKAFDADLVKQSTSATLADGNVLYDNSKAICSLVPSSKAVIFISNSGCDEAAEIELEVEQLEYDGDDCPSKSRLLVILISVILAAALLIGLVVCVACRLCQCICCCK